MSKQIIWIGGQNKLASSTTDADVLRIPLEITEAMRVGNARMEVAGVDYANRDKIGRPIYVSENSSGLLIPFHDYKFNRRMVFTGNPCRVDSADH